MAGVPRIKSSNFPSSPAGTAASSAFLSSGQQASESAAAPVRLREVLDIRQAADYLGISPDSLYKYASENFIPAFKLGNRWRFKRSLLERWMERQSSLPTPATQEKPPKPKQKKPSARAR